MAEYFKIHPVTPQKNVLAKTVEVLAAGGTILYPTDTSYGFACSITSKKGQERLARLKRLPDNHQYSLICPDLSTAANYAVINDWAFRLLKKCLPGPYTFVLHATREVPKKLLPKRKTIGLRIPDHQVCFKIMELFDQPLLSTTAKLPGLDPIIDPSEFKTKLGESIDLILDGGIQPASLSTVVDLTQDEINVIRLGIGDIGLLGARL